MTTVNRFFTVFAAILAALHVWAALSPSHYNWGLHYFAFYPAVQALSALVPAIFVLVPRYRNGMTWQLTRFAGAFGGLPAAGIFILLAVVLVALMLLFPAKLHLLGDSEIILALTPKLPSIADESANFRNQPLTYEALRLIQWASGGGSSVEPAFLYRVADGIAGIAFLALLVYFLRALRPARIDALLIGSFLFFSSASQFFLGYVENYMFFYVAVCAYAVTGWLALRGTVPAWVPLAVLAVTPAFHLAGAIFLPTALFLFIPRWKENRRALIVAVAGVVLGLAALVVFLGPSWVATRVANALQYDLLPFATPEGGIPYGMFSAAHLVDWANAVAHIAPFGFAIVAIGLVAVARKDYWTDPVFRFLAWTSLTGVAASFAILPGLGMARDWDMFANFFVPLAFFSAYFLMLLVRSPEARHGVVIIVVVAFVRWCGWIGVNADETRHLTRAEMLSVPELSGTFPKLYYENLGKTLYDRREYARSAAWYERYLAVDSTNARILANLSDNYRALGDSANVFRMLELSVAAGTDHPGVYSNLAIEYIARGDTGRAIRLLNRALEHNPGHMETRANLSILELERGNYAEGLKHSIAAIRMGMTEPIFFRNAGYASYFLGDYTNAVTYFDRYLQAAPSDAAVRKLADTLRKRQ